MTTTEQTKPSTSRGMTSCILMVDDFPYQDTSTSIVPFKMKEALVVESIDEDGEATTLRKGKDYDIFTLLNYGGKENSNVNVIGLVSKDVYTKLCVSNEQVGWSCIVPLSKYTTKDKVFVTIPGEKLMKISVLCNPNVVSVKLSSLDS